MSRPAATACVLIIGNEILSGKTQDANLKFLGTELSRLGIRLEECRVVRDDTDAIIAHVNECRARFDYVFTTGGIGPTHDDITAASIAKAFGTELILDETAVERLRRGSGELNEARLKMARVPRGSTLIDNTLSHAPGFRIENVFVLAGIPAVARAMFAAAASELASGAQILSAGVDVYLKEGDIAGPLEHIAARYPDVEVGSYPFSRDGRFGASLVVRGVDAATIERVLAEVTVAMQALGGETRLPPGGS